MRKLLYIALLFSSIVHGQAPGTFSAPFNIPTPYGTPNSVVQQISTFTPADSTTGGHPCVLMLGGAGEVVPPNNYNITGNTLAYYVKNNGASARIKNPTTGLYETYYIIWCYKNQTSDASGDWDYRYIKNAWKYATTALAGKVNPSRIYLSCLSLSGGGGADLIRDSIIWCQRFAAVAICDAVVGKIYVDNQSDIYNNINTSGLHARFWWASGDNQSTSPTFRDKMEFYYGGSSGNTTRPQLMIINGGGHGSGWTAANDTAHTPFSNNTTYTPSGTNNPNTLEWFLQYTSSYAPVNQPPVSNAGSPQTITLPTSSVVLNGSGSYDPDGRPLTGYLWSRVSGPNTPVFSNATVVSPTVTGLIQGSYVFNLRVTDDSAATANSTVAITVNAQPPPGLVQARIRAYYDALYAGYDRNSPDGFYDSQNGGKFNADPENSVTTDTTSVNNPAHGWNTSPGSPAKMYDHYGFGKINKTTPYYVRDSVNSRCRVIFDLVGVRDAMDTVKKFIISKIWGLSAEEAGIKIYLYNYDKILRLPVAQRSINIARADSLRTPFAIISTNGNNVWTSTTCLDTMRYVMMVITGTSTQHIAQFNELLFYGPKYTFDTTASSYKDSIRSMYYTGALPSHKNSTYTFGNVIGTNWFNGMGPQSRRFDGPIRLYTAQSYGDTANTAAMPTVFKYYPAGFLDFNNAIISTIKTEGHEAWVTSQAQRAYNGSQGVSANVDTIGGDPETPGNWKAESSLMKNYARVWGRNTSGTNAFSIHPTNGQNLFNTMEMGNESKLHGYSELADFWRMKNDYDSIKSVDPTMKVIQPGMVDWAVNDVRTIWFFTQTLTADRVVPIDAANGHKYLGKYDSLKQFVTLTEQVGSTSVPPEWAISSKHGYLKYMDSITREIYAYLPNIDIYFTETSGRSKYGTPSANTTQASYYDLFITPSVGSWDSTQVVALHNNRQDVLTLFTPIKRMTSYSIINQAGGTINYPDLFYAMGRGGTRSSSNFEITSFSPDWYIRAGTYARLKNYYGDSVLVNGGRTGQWIVRLRNYLYADSICTVSWYGSYNNSSNTLIVPTNTVNNVEEYVPSFASETGTSTILTPTLGNVSRVINEQMKFYFARESPTPNVPAGCPCGTLNIYRYAFNGTLSGSENLVVRQLIGAYFGTTPVVSTAPLDSGELANLRIIIQTFTGYTDGSGALNEIEVTTTRQIIQAFTT